MRAALRLSSDPQEMHGTTQDEAIRKIAAGRTDELLDDILRAYEAYRARHDFVVVEGTSLKDGQNTTTLNAQIASMLGAPALLLVDAGVAAGEGLTAGGSLPPPIGSSREEEVRAAWDELDWETDVTNSALMGKRALESEHVDVLGALVHRVPPSSRKGDELRRQLADAGVPLIGAIPEDATLQALQVQDVVGALKAEPLYGTEHEAALSTEVTRVIIATPQLADLLGLLPRRAPAAEVTCFQLPAESSSALQAEDAFIVQIECIGLYGDPTKGSVVLASASRTDVLLGMHALHESHSLSNIAALVLTGGTRPGPAVDTLIRNRMEEGTLPVFCVSTPTYEAAIAVSQAEGHIRPTSTRKIERAQVLFDDNVDMDLLRTMLLKERAVRMNPKLFQHTLFQHAKGCRQHIVLPEKWLLIHSQGEELRTIHAAGEVMRRGLADLTLLGNQERIQGLAKQHHVDLGGVQIVNPPASPKLEDYTRELYDARKHKVIDACTVWSRSRGKAAGVSKEALTASTRGNSTSRWARMKSPEAREQLVADVNFYGTAMVAAGDADGMVSGAIHTTANTVRPALQVIKTQPGSPLVSSVFFMCLPDRVLVYGDCAINTEPTAEELSYIATASADTAAAFGLEPRVAMLSYATGDSNKGPAIQRVIDATKLAKERRPDLKIEGPLQYDAAVNPQTAQTKLKGRHSEVAGQASVLIFPDLNTGNNTYKAVQQSTGAIAMGPVLQGLRKPVNDLSRGCTVADIVTTIAITAVQAQAQRGIEGAVAQEG
eukprot:SM000029S10440  [mRNA]  locus=s29:178187:183224:- [translate_table: standard]